MAENTETKINELKEWREIFSELSAGGWAAVKNIAAEFGELSGLVEDYLYGNATLEELLSELENADE